VTISKDETVERVLIKGRELMMSSFPVMDGDQVVGIVSDREIFVTLFKLLEAGDVRTRITLSNVTLKQGTLTEITRIVDQCNSTTRAIFTVPEGKNGEVRIVLRAECEQPEVLKKALEDKGYQILEYVP